MAAIITFEKDAVMSQLLKRDDDRNWAAKNVGPMVVFCIVFVVALLVIGVYTNKWLTARRERRERKAVA
ncbi:hypothetical protein VHEMI08730 [[Torrubiella] hemipterigena]|uniref:Uncharacterized protein n=1 Tax=[Torrubiella] hemipterigena TaxID=1531966 RepID=A0A0A1T7L3_9HYPO|nr:hypothetical protein VHEMI08730 [[Torrubiella] hemipterigena]